MCFCDGCYFLVTNKSTGEKHFINGDEPLYSFFERLYSLPLLFHRLLKKEYVQLNVSFMQFHIILTLNVNESEQVF